eukprot:10995828-Lingulodinium_polyedra.AAC.2
MTGAALPPARRPALRSIEDGYQELRTCLDADIPTKSEAVPQDIICETALGWWDLPAVDNCPAATRRHSTGPGGENGAMDCARTRPQSPMTSNGDARALADVVLGGIPRGQLPPARPMRWRACCRALKDVAPGLDPRRIARPLLCGGAFAGALSRATAPPGTASCAMPPWDNYRPQLPGDARLIAEDSRRGTRAGSSTPAPTGPSPINRSLKNCLPLRLSRSSRRRIGPRRRSLWRGGVLPHVGDAFTAAKAGARGGLQKGGVILCPAPWRLVEQHCLAPGCAVAAKAMRPR